MSTIELLSFSMRKEAPKAGDDWFKIIVDKKNDVAKIYIYDEIGYWGTSAKAFVAELDAIETGTIHLHINSPGGSVFDGLAIGAAIQNHTAKVIGKVDGMAASAASFILQYCDEREITRNAQVMIHDASAYAGGNAAAMRRAADLLDRVSNNIADIYATKSGKGSVKSWRALMTAGDQWYSGDEALTAGLVDTVTDNPDEDAPDEADNSWTQDEVNAFLVMPAATLAQDSTRSIITNHVQEDAMNQPAPPVVPQPPAVDPTAQTAPAPAPTPTAPAAPSPVAGLVNVVVDGVTHQVPQALATRFTALETFQTETVEGHRKSFIAELASKNVIPATEIQDAETLALGMTNAQFDSWKKLMSSAPASPLFAVHGTTPGNTQAPSNGGAATATQTQIEILEATVQSHRDGGATQEQIEAKDSWKQLQALKKAAGQTA